MGATKHTAGPWAVEVMPSGRPTITAGQLFVTGDEGGILDLDDARRIVLCVNSHDELRDALAKLVCEPGNPDYRDSARAALAKAMGDAL